MEDFLEVSLEIWKWKQKSYLCANSCVSHVQVTKKLIMDKYLKTFLVILICAISGGYKNSIRFNFC